MQLFEDPRMKEAVDTLKAQGYTNRQAVNKVLELMKSEKRQAQQARPRISISGKDKEAMAGQLGQRNKTREQTAKEVKLSIKKKAQPLPSSPY